MPISIIVNLRKTSPEILFFKINNFQTNMRTEKNGIMKYNVLLYGVIPVVDAHVFYCFLLSNYHFERMA